MSDQVQLYVYDLSNGMAKQLSLGFTGKQLDGIWHTSVVVFGKEIFYGRGICTAHPGRSHHGKPQHILPMGETALDEETFNEYLAEMRQHYTADKYHLLDFNCNSFTNDCVGFLTGNSIPSWISNLSSDFLSTPLGAALRPTIDRMFSPSPSATPTPERVQPSPQPSNPAMDPAVAASILQAVASQAMRNGFPSSSSGAGPSAQPTQVSSTPNTSTQTLTSPIHICTNPSSFRNILSTHKATIAFFTSATCGPCRMIEPLFDQLGYEKTRAGGPGGGTGVAFVKVDLSVGMSNMVGGEYGVRVTPTFIFFRDGKKVHEFKGVNQPELKSQVDLLLWDAFPPHPHTKLSIPALDKVSTNPILFAQVPALEAVSTKLSSFIDAASPPIPQTAKQSLTGEFITWLQSRFSPKAKAKQAKPSPQVLTKWVEATKILTNALSPAQLFPLVDMWRLALLDESVSGWCAASVGTTTDLLQMTLVKALTTLANPQSTPRPYVLTALRFLSNAFSNDGLARSILTSKRTGITSFLVANLLHADGSVRTAAASLAFNIAAFIQKGRVEAVGARYGPFASGDDEGEWEVELVSAVLEAIGQEVQSEEVVHRLTASLAFILRFSPSYDAQIAPLLEVLQAKETLKAKLSRGGCGEEGVSNPDVKKLIQQVSDNLC